MNEDILKQWAIQALAASPYPDPRFPPSPYYRFLRIAALNLQPRLSVELGVCGGGGSLHLALGWPLGRVVGIDVVEDHKENTDYIARTCPNFELWIGDSIALAQSVRLQHGQPDIIFVDTIHTRERTLAEFNAWELYLSDRAIVCFDDLHRPGMEQAWAELPGHKVRLDDLHSGRTEGGFGVVWK
jgi:predicted O-methyltransferase YrrM